MAKDIHDVFRFDLGHRFAGDEIDVVVKQLVPAHPVKGYVPAYDCRVVKAGSSEQIGRINVRVGYVDSLVKYGGHIGYGIDEAHRGRRYACKACQLVKPIFVAHGIDVIWITCNPDNWPSRKTCEYLGCQFVEIVDLPEDNDMYLEGERQKCRYRLIVY